MRKMMSVQSVESLSPIVNADFIEVARILGWNVVVTKGKFAPGDKVAYFEIDSLLPETDTRFESFQARGQNTTITETGEEIRGHVVRTMKFRGIYSQGLVIGFDELGYTADQIESLSIDDDLSEENGIIKWEETVPESNDVIGKFETQWMPKTGSERLQNLSAHWGEITTLHWEATVKVDGKSQTLLNNGETVKLFGHNWELDKNIAEGYSVSVKHGLVAEIEKHPRMAIQFELVGPGIAKNRLKLAEKRPFVFAVWQDGKKLPRSEWPEAVLALAVPVIEDLKPSGSLDEMIEKVSELRGSITKDVLDEGVVFHNLSETIPMWMSRNASFKIVSNKFLTKHKL